MLLFIYYLFIYLFLSFYSQSYMAHYFCSLSVSLFTCLIQTVWDSGAYVMIFLWNLNSSLRHKNTLNFAMTALNTSLVSMAYKTVVINITELYVFYDNMSQMSGLMHSFLPYFPTISVSICPLMIDFFLLLHFFLSLCAWLFQNRNRSDQIPINAKSFPSRSLCQ